MQNTPVANLKGVGAARAEALNKLGITTYGDLLLLHPRGYLDYANRSFAGTVQHGDMAAVQLLIHTPPRQIRPRKGLQMTVVAGSDETGAVQITWFNQPFRMQQITVGEQYVFCGRVDTRHGKKLINPDIYKALPGVLPVYPLRQGLSQKQLQYYIRQALDACLPSIEETLPETLCKQYGLCGRKQALHDVHMPPDRIHAEQAMRRLAFEDTLLYMVAISMLKSERAGERGIAYRTAEAKNRIKTAFPFALTEAQQRVVGEIAADMEKPAPMNRLVQGDVGSGKTVLAIFAMLVAQSNGKQAALLAPTELLAQQHYQTLTGVFGENVVLLKGSMKKSERDAAYHKIASGEVSCIVGTHALLQEQVAFHDLGLVITDEQHRFGVRQRATLPERAKNSAVSGMPDMLIMSATPIPRTLAMLLYGDLSISIVNGMPPGRMPVVTRYVPENKREDMYRYLAEESRKGNQAYVVCPLVEQSEAMEETRSAAEVYQELNRLLPGIRIGLLHGRMASAKKTEALQAFRDGALDMIVATTVVEVGVDVQNATAMVIENAERFGLAQLHQLRGRVGRGSKRSYCFLLSESESEVAKQRLEVLTKTNDGFAVAQKDLELRGPGEFLGTRQHGLDEFSAMQMAGNMDILLMAQKAAEDVMAHHREAEYQAVYESAKVIYERRMKNTSPN